MSINQPAPSNNMSCQRFCLRWNNHQSNLLSVFDQLLHDESFVDVTLAVEGQLLKAHKMVLSACSPYFQALFVNHPDKHPIVILKDVPYSDMRCLLDFMYRGEVSVDQDRLTAFLRVAESLRIKGLTEVNEEKCDSITSSLAQNQNSNLYKLQRLQPPQKYNAMNMLGHALLQPKRKRGRPRKLSGSSNGTPGADDFDRSDSLLQGSPEMLEVKMGMDGFPENNSDSSSGNKEKDEEEDKSNHEISEPVAGTSKETFNNAVVVKNENDFQASDDNIDFLENNQNHSNLPELPDNVTLDIVPIKYQQESVIISTEAARNMLMDSQEQDDEFDKMDHESESLTGIHFLTDDENAVSETYERKKNELLEYIMRDDGSVVCKLCGELLASRTHWYRHKYKFHVNNLVNPAPLFKCKYCNVFFKSRKGYLGHIASRHTEVEPPQEEINISIKEEIIESVELPIPKIPKKRDSKTTDWEEQRVKEEKLVAAIIARVRKECEAQGSAVSRRGYSRRSTVMMNTT